MSGSTLWKFLLTAVVVLLAVLNLIPYKDRPFEEYALSQVRASGEYSRSENQQRFNDILDQARALVASGEAPTNYVALQQLGREEGLDYAAYFPQVNVHDILNRNRRNEVLLGHLLHKSQSKIRFGLDLMGGVGFTLAIADESAAKDGVSRESQMEKLVDIMGSRIDGLGVAEPIIRRRGDRAVEIQLPGVSTRDNPEAIDTLKKPARLEFRLVHRSADPETTARENYPAGYEVLTYEMDGAGGEVIETQLFVKRFPEATGEIVARAYPSMTQAGGYQVAMDFTAEGGRQFGELTGRIAQENQRTGTIGRMAIVLDGKLYTAPSVETAITQGSAVINGRFTQREVIELANVLNNPLQYELEVEEVYEVGPTLASEARTSSVYAAILGSVLVLGFMVFYYRTAGLVAVITLVVNMVLVLGALASIGATLSLPSVAALLLTLGMATDGQIIVYERIRDELREGKNLTSAINQGFAKAFSTIIDANLTTLITAGILVWVGSGPVRGFGVTLGLGILASMFCVLIVNRFLLELLVDSKLVKKMMNFSLIGETDIDFPKYRKLIFLASWSIILLGLATIVVKGNRIYGIDFLGGSEVTLAYTEALPINDIQATAEALGIQEVVVNYRTEIGTAQERLVLQTVNELLERGDGTQVPAAQALVTTLQEQYPAAGLDLLSENTIGGAVSSQLKWNALWSISAALLAMLLYIALRFELGYGIGAVVASVHDVLMTIGLFVLLGYQFSAPMVAAVLMVAGYSINATIIIFDRIREQLQLHPTLNLYAIIRLAINQTLARTIITSLTTLMAAMALWIFGGGVITDFALIFIFGIITGAISSIFIAPTVFYWWHKGDRRHVEERELTPKYEWEHSSKVAR